jgi:hypothetical protein
MKLRYFDIQKSDLSIVNGLIHTGLPLFWPYDDVDDDDDNDDDDDDDDDDGDDD